MSQMIVPSYINNMLFLLWIIIIICINREFYLNRYSSKSPNLLFPIPHNSANLINGKSKSRSSLHSTTNNTFPVKPLIRLLFPRLHCWPCNEKYGVVILKRSLNLRSELLLFQINNSDHCDFCRSNATLDNVNS